MKGTAPEISAASKPTRKPPSATVEAKRIKCSSPRVLGMPAVEISNEQARVHGKGNKIRLCPLWPKTAKQLRTLVDRQELGNTDRSNAFAIKNRAGGQLTRFGVRYLLRKYLPDYQSLSRRRKIHPHSLRHTTEIHLQSLALTSGQVASFWVTPAFKRQCATHAPISILNAKRWHRCFQMFSARRRPAEWHFTARN
jgi:hypothetical protein